MKKKTLICILIISVIIVAIVIVLLKNNKTDDTYSKLDFVDNENKYIITTNIKWRSMQSDGGSHIDIYYQVDLNDNNVKKCEDKYVGFEGYEYQEKVLFSKELNETEKNELKTILNNVIINGTEEEPYTGTLIETLNLEFFIISSFNNEDIKIYDKDVINSIKKILEK